MNKIQYNRLIKLGKYLIEFDKIPIEDQKVGFNFIYTLINIKNHSRESILYHPCGTVGCAIGHLPLVFKSAFRYEKNSDELRHIPSKRYVGYENYQYDIIADFFGINREKFMIIFGYADRYEQLTENATATEVGEHIIRRANEWYNKNN